MIIVLNTFQQIFQTSHNIPRNFKKLRKSLGRNLMTHENVCRTDFKTIPNGNSNSQHVIKSFSRCHKPPINFTRVSKTPANKNKRPPNFIFPMSDSFCISSVTFVPQSIVLTELKNAFQFGTENIYTFMASYHI